MAFLLLQKQGASGHESRGWKDGPVLPSPLLEDAESVRLAMGAGLLQWYPVETMGSFQPRRALSLVTAWTLTTICYFITVCWGECVSLRRIKNETGKAVLSASHYLHSKYACAVFNKQTV